MSHPTLGVGRSLALALAVVGLGCAGPGEGEVGAGAGGGGALPPPVTRDTAAATAPPAETGDTAAAPPPTLVKTLAVYNQAERCWTDEQREVAAEFWQAWFDNDCGSTPDFTRYRFYGTADGECIGVKGGFGWREGCDMADPWVVDCAEVRGCCRAGPVEYCPIWE